MTRLQKYPRCLFMVLAVFLRPLYSQEEPIRFDRELHPLEALSTQEDLYSVHFESITALELVQFISKITGQQILFDARDLAFQTSLFLPHPTNKQTIIQALTMDLENHGCLLTQDGECLVIKGAKKQKQVKQEAWLSLGSQDSPLGSLGLLTYTVRYHEGSEIDKALKNIAKDLSQQADCPKNLVNAIQSIQWVPTTNTLVGSADQVALKQLKALIERLDTPLKQVFIEVLVVETSVGTGSEFGIQWGLKGSHEKSQIQFQGSKNSPGRAAPSWKNQPSSSPGFELGVIGDLIWHKGELFSSLSALISALQEDGESTIVLNQKIVAQDNKEATIFVGDNIPFPGTVVETVGQTQQTTSAIDYRDVGVRLTLKPRVGEGNEVSLLINQEITESIEGGSGPSGGIRTTKTNMSTQVHVPNDHFLVISGMGRKAHVKESSRIPCLGAIPLIGSLTGQTKKREDQRSLTIFVRPQIVSAESYVELSEKAQGDLSESHAEIKRFLEESGL